MTANPNEIRIAARTEKLPELLAYVERRLEEADCSPKAQMQIVVAIEEVFVNIAMYAYAPGVGDADFRMEISGDPPTAEFRFADRGIPYDPTAREDPDITLPAEQREVGGLGILMTKKFMDEVSYEYRDGQNLLTLRKRLR